MAGIFVFSVLLTLLFGGGMLALVFGFLETEKSRALATANQGVPAQGPEAVTQHPFFTNLDENASVLEPTSSDDELIDDLESFLKTEMALAARFVNEPSIQNLYRPASTSSAVH